MAIGEQGSGKTLMGTILAINALMGGKPVYTTDDTFTPPPQFANCFRVIDNPRKFLWDDKRRSCFVFIDEMDRWFDSGKHMTRANKEFSRWQRETQKRNIDLYGTAHTFRRVELDVRENLNELWTMHGVESRYDEETGEETHWLIYTVTNMRQRFAFPETLELRVDEYYDYFDTEHFLGVGSIAEPT